MVKSEDSEYLYKVEEERVGVPVKGGLYEVCTLFSGMLCHYRYESCIDHYEVELWPLFVFYPLLLTTPSSYLVNVLLP